MMTNCQLSNSKQFSMWPSQSITVDVFLSKQVSKDNIIG